MFLTVLPVAPDIMLVRPSSRSVTTETRSAIADTKPCSCSPNRFNPSWPARAADLNVTFNQYGQRDQASSRDRLLWTTRLLHFDRADFSTIWVKERQEWWGRVRRRDPQASAGA
jgi:hypothetical protein